MTKPKSVSEPEKFIQLWIHEASWVFHDWLINEEDREFFKTHIIDILEVKFREKWTLDDVFKQQIIFSNLLKLGADDELYE